MRIQHLNCATLCPPGGSLVGCGKLVCHCLLIETSQGLVLVDTGLGAQDVRSPLRRLGLGFNVVCGPRLLEQETAARQVAALGYDAQDVRHIILTHLDADHGGGVEDFPKATVHLLKREQDACREPKIFRERFLYRGLGRAHAWKAYEDGGEDWLGFAGARQLDGLPPEILLVPLPGHTAGHCGVAVRAGAGWLLHCGDAFFDRREVMGAGAPWSLRAYANIVQADRRQRLRTVERLRALASNSKSVELACSHDAVTFEMLSRRPAPIPS